LKVGKKNEFFLVKVCHGRFHDILPKEYSGTFPGLHGDLKKRCLLTTGVSQIMYLTKLISEIKYIPSEGFFTILVFFLPAINALDYLAG
jgi:hypothetical protein